MRKVIVVSTFAMAGIFSAQALADRGKAGFYTTDKAGAPVVTQTNQHFRQDFEDDVYKYKGGDKDDTVLGAGPAMDYDSYQHHNVPMRTEVEFYSRGTTDSYYILDTWHSPVGNGGREGTWNRLSVNTLMVDTYYDFGNSSAFIPWVSAGLGCARIHHRATYTDISWDRSGEVSDIPTLHYSGYDNSFAWSIGAGIRYDITPDIALDLNCHYLDAGKSPLSYKDVEGDKYKLEVDIKSHDITFGMAYNF